MRHGSLGGDWIEFTYDQFNEVCRVIEQIDYLEVIRYLREPAIRILNLQVMENSKGKLSIMRLSAARMWTLILRVVLSLRMV